MDTHEIEGSAKGSGDSPRPRGLPRIGNYRQFIPLLAPHLKHFHEKDYLPEDVSKPFLIRKMFQPAIKMPSFRH
ncbi:MAG: hypothetical protein ACOYMG_06530, partial [Candidatus Methylumidiphilus sp.]